VGVDEPVAGHVPEPELKGHRRVGEVFAQPSVGLEQHILDDVAGIHAALHATIHAAVDHPLDRLPMPGEQPVDGPGFPPAHAVEQDERRRRVGGRRPVANAVPVCRAAGWGGHEGRTDGWRGRGRGHESSSYQRVARTDAAGRDGRRGTPPESEACRARGKAGGFCPAGKRDP
jgi:hypothetical protein